MADSEHPTEPNSQQTKDSASEPESLSFWQMLGSTFAAAIGVQSAKNRERDFSRGKAHHFIFMGIGFTVVFVLLMVLLVRLVLSTAS